MVMVRHIMYVKIPSAGSYIVFSLFKFIFKIPFPVHANFKMVTLTKACLYCVTCKINFGMYVLPGCCCALNLTQVVAGHLIDHMLNSALLVCMLNDERTCTHSNVFQGI